MKARTRTLLTILGTATVMLCLVASAAATNMYIAPEGDNSSECLSPVDPCQTISAAASKAAMTSAGEYILNVAARDENGEPAVYAETVSLVPMLNTPTYIVDGAWRSSTAGDKATIRPASGSSYALQLVIEGSTLRNLRIDATQMAPTSVALMSVPGAGSGSNTFENLDIHAAAEAPGISLGGLTSPLLSRIVLHGSGAAPALALGGNTGVRMVDSTILDTEAQDPTVSSDGPDAPSFIRTAIRGSATAPQVINANFGDGSLVLDSSLVTGGADQAIYVNSGSAAPLTIVSSTIDAGVGGQRDPGSAALRISDGSAPFGVEIRSSILVEAPDVGQTGAPATLACVATDVPSTEIAVGASTRAVNCGAGSDGNTDTAPAQLFAGGDYANLSAYRLRPGSPAIDTGIRTPERSDSDLAGAPRSQSGGSCNFKGETDRGALEAGCLKPKLSKLKLSKKKVKRGKTVTVKFRLNLAAKVQVKAGKAKAKLSLKKSKVGGTNKLKLKTRKLKPRKKAYKVKVVATDAGGAKVTKTLKLWIR